MLDNFFYIILKRNRFYDLNLGLVLGLGTIGRGYSVARKFLSILNLLSLVNKALWSVYTKVIKDIIRSIFE